MRDLVFNITWPRRVIKLRFVQHLHVIALPLSATADRHDPLVETVRCHTMCVGNTLAKILFFHEKNIIEATSNIKLVIFEEHDKTP